MKLPRNSKLPINAIVQFVTKKGKAFRVKVLTQGTIVSQGEDGIYRIRPQHAFQHIPVAPDQIRYILLYPGAPKPAPRFPQPRPRSHAASIENGQPLPVVPAPPPPQPELFDKDNGFMPPELLTASASYPITIKGGVYAGKYADIAPLIAAAGNMMPDRGYDWAHVILTDIEAGKLDGSLQTLADTVHARLKLLRVAKVGEMKEKLNVGDRVRIVGRLRPRRLVGCDGTVRKIGGTKFVSVELDGGRSYGIPANCLEKI